MSATTNLNGLPEKKVSVSQLFGFDSNMEVSAFDEPAEHVPELDTDYLFNKETTLAILAGFAFNRRVMITGYHGTGKSTHIEQVAARLNWPCIRINLDSHISRIDLIGKDAIVLKDGKQITEFKEGILPWSYQHNVALVFDEYDAGRPDVMFVIQRILESSGKLTLLDQSRVIRPHSACSPRPTRWALVIPQAFITARNRSIRRRWIAGRLSPPSTICRTRKKWASFSQRINLMKTTRAAR
jgi:cobaltochelatase CobS